IEGAVGSLKVAEPQPSKLDRANKALEEAQGEPSAEAITSKRKAEQAKKAEEAEAAKKAEEEAAKAAEAAAESESGSAGGGRTASAIRTIVTSVAGPDVRVDVVDTDR